MRRKTEYAMLCHFIAYRHPGDPYDGEDDDNNDDDGNGDDDDGDDHDNDHSHYDHLVHAPVSQFLWWVFLYLVCLIHLVYL